MQSPQNLNDIVTVQNIDTDPHEVVYDKLSYGTIEPGQTRQLPRFLASHAMKHMINHILNKRQVASNNQIERQKLADKILISVTKVVEEAKKTEAEQLRDKVKELNDPSDLDLLMAKKEVEEGEAPTPPETPPSSPAPTKPEEMSVEELEALLAEKKGEEPQPEEVKSEEGSVEEKPESIATETNPDIDRDGLYKWAESELGLTIFEDEKTKKALDEKSVEEVKKELGYE